MKIGIGNDHSALELKAEIIDFLKEKGHEVVDYGTNSPESCDYPIYGEKVARAVAAGEVEKGILICGTGLGISLAANKVEGIRAVVCSEPFTAKMSRAHNDCNVLAFGARVVGAELAKMIVDTWLDYVKDKRTVVFCASVKHAEQIAELFKEKGVTAAAVSGSMKTSERNEMLAKFAAG